MKKKYTLSVVMIVKNEAENLRVSVPALVDWVDELIVLDSGSTDDSQQVIEQYGGKWFVNDDWPGFGKQRQLAQSYATGDWILALDADEEVTATLKNSILAVIQHPPSDTVYGIKRLDYVFGHCIDNPYWGIKAHWRLYPKKFQFNDNLVHESVVLGEAQTQKLDGFLKHHTAVSPRFWLQKRLDYALTWANDRHQQGKTVPFYKVVINPLWAFVKQYLIDGRFLQGKYGLVYALFFTQYTFNKYAILYDMGRQPQSYRDDFEPHAINRHAVFDLPLPDKVPHPYTLSVVMIVKNEQKHLPACLHNIYDLADEIVTLDSGSTDDTQRIAEHFGAKWRVHQQWEGFGKQRQRAQAAATGDYILMLDPDELPNAALKADILKKLQQPPCQKTVFAIRYANMFCGHPAHGNAWYFDKILRFYPSNYRYHDYEVHESLNYGDADIQVLDGYINHYTNDNFYHFLFKNVRYSHDWAMEKVAQKKRQVSFLSLPIRALVSFVREFVLRGAFLGGVYGFFLSVAASGYNLNKYVMFWHEKQKNKSC